jgi:Fanconi anemia group J protein
MAAADKKQQPVSGSSFQVAGFDVHFPHQAYGVQKVFMNQVLKAIDHAENALLEAPTGCGKTLSLLCGALAWQTAQKQKKAAAEQKLEQQRKAAAGDTAGTAADGKPNCLAPIKRCIDDGDSDVDEPSNSSGTGEGRQKLAAEEEPVTVPKIYYATRTHSQIAQVGNNPQSTHQLQIPVRSILCRQPLLV